MSVANNLTRASTRGDQRSQFHVDVCTCTYIINLYSEDQIKSYGGSR